MADGKSQYRQENGVSLIEIRLNTIQQLFNSFDPAPFNEKDLDQEAEDYITESARELPIATPLKLIVHVPPQEITPARDAGVEEAVHHYFGYKAHLERIALRRKLTYGRTTFMIAAAFLVVCIILRELVQAAGDSTAHEIIAEGLLISGWVALWQPVQVFLYGWWPIWQTCRLYEKLARLPVDLRSPKD